MGEGGGGVVVSKYSFRLTFPWHAAGNTSTPALRIKQFAIDCLILTQVTQAQCMKTETEHYRRLQSELVQVWLVYCNCFRVSHLLVIETRRGWERGSTVVLKDRYNKYKTKAYPKFTNLSCIVFLISYKNTLSSKTDTKKERANNRN